MGDGPNKDNNIIELNSFYKKKEKKTKSPEQLDNISKLNREKRKTFESFLEHGLVCVLLDARYKEVSVPSEFKSHKVLRLNFCHEFRINDFAFSDEGVSATLKFPSGRFFCIIPWGSVFGLESESLGKNAMFFESFPKDLAKREMHGDDLINKIPRPKKVDEPVDNNKDGCTVGKPSLQNNIVHINFDSNNN